MTIDKAKNDLERLVDDFQDFLMVKELFDAHVKVFKELGVDSQHVYVFFIRGSFFQYAIATLGRMIYESNGSLSLLSFLREFKTASKALDRSSYVANVGYHDIVENGVVIAKSPIREALLGQYDELFGSDLETVIQKDLKDLEGDKGLAKIKKVRHEVVAHKSKDETSYSITTVELDYAIDKVEEVLLKYRLLLTQNGPISKGSLSVVIPYDWQELAQEVGNKLNPY